MATDVGTGTTFTLGGPTALDTNFTGVLTSIEHSGWSAESVETTHMGSTSARSFISSDLYDPGEITIEGHFQPTNNVPAFGTIETLTINYAASAGTTKWRVSGFLTEFSISDPLEDVMTFSATFKATGTVAKVA